MDTPPLGSIGIGQLIARIDRSWDARDGIRATIERRLPALRGRAARTNELLLALLGEESERYPIDEAERPIQPH